MKITTISIMYANTKLKGYHRYRYRLGGEKNETF